MTHRGYGGKQTSNVTVQSALDARTVILLTRSTFCGIMMPSVVHHRVLFQWELVCRVCVADRSVSGCVAYVHVFGQGVVCLNTAETVDDFINASASEPFTSSMCTSNVPYFVCS